MRVGVLSTSGYLSGKKSLTYEKNKYKSNSRGFTEAIAEIEAGGDVRNT